MEIFKFNFLRPSVKVINNHIFFWLFACLALALFFFNYLLFFDLPGVVHLYLLAKSKFVFNLFLVSFLCNLFLWPWFFTFIFCIHNGWFFNYLIMILFKFLFDFCLKLPLLFFNNFFILIKNCFSLFNLLFNHFLGLLNFSLSPY